MKTIPTAGNQRGTVHWKSYLMTPFLGNVRNGYFHFEAVEPVDISKFVEVMLTLISVDLVSLVSSSIFLKLCCNINLFKVTIVIQSLEILVFLCFDLTQRQIF